LEREIKRTKQHKKLHEMLRLKSKSVDTTTTTLYSSIDSDPSSPESPISQSNFTHTFSSPLFPLPEDLYLRNYHNSTRRQPTSIEKTETQITSGENYTLQEQEQQKEEDPNQQVPQHETKQLKRKIIAVDEDEDSLTEDDDEMLNHKKQRVYYQLQVNVSQKNASH